MSESKLDARARAFVVMLSACAGFAALELYVRCDTARVVEQTLELAVFLTLGLAWSLLTFNLGRRKSGSLGLSLAPASYVALVPLAEGAIVVSVGVLVIVFDWVAHRRRAYSGLFNLAQTVCGLWLALLVAAWVREQAPGTAGIALAGFAGAAAASVVGFVTTPVVLYFASGRRFSETGAFSYGAITNETVLICFAALMAMSWAQSPILLALTVAPMTMLFLLLARLEQREVSLEQRRAELQAIQELGLEVSARIEATDLARAVTRIVAEDLRAAGTALAFVSDNRRALEVRAVHDVRHRETPLPTRILRRVFDEAFFEAGNARLFEGASAELVPELDAFCATGAVALPLRILGRPDAILLVYNDGGRDPFNEEDVRRLVALARFIEVALNNARLYDDLRRMQEQLVQREKLSALGELVSGVAHELNNPLAVVMGNSEMLETQDLPPDARRIVGVVHKEASRAARIVRDLLTFSRNQRPERGWHDIGAVIQEVVTLRAEECREKDIQLRAELSPEVPPLSIDPHQMHQVLVNLVTNAIHAIEDTERGGTIVLRTLRAGARIHVIVADDGPGIPEDVLPKIFNPFFTTKRVGRGTGLGLSICYGIVQAHGGAFRVRSVPGQGASFVIELPAPRPEEIAAMIPTAESPKRHSEPILGGGRRVLVVDDEEGVRTLVREALELWEFQVQEASSGEAALSLLASLPFDLVVTDLRMPGLDGPGLYEQAGALCATVPPFVFVTGDAASQEMRRFLDGVRSPVLVKPFTLMSLREAIESALLAQQLKSTLVEASSAQSVP